MPYVAGEQLLLADFSALLIVLNLLTLLAIADHQLATAQLYVELLLCLAAVFNKPSPWAIASQHSLAMPANKPMLPIANFQCSIDCIARKNSAVLCHYSCLQPIASLLVPQKQLAHAFAAAPALDYLMHDPAFQKLIHQLAA